MNLDEFIKQCEGKTVETPSAITRCKLMEIIASKMKRCCDNCADYMVCYEYGTLNRENCTDWEADPMEVENILDSILIKHVNR